MLITTSQAQQKQNGNTCTVQEYAFPSKELGFATAQINGRYPEQGKAINTKCDTMYYITGGSGTIHHQSGDVPVQTGDAFFFPKGERYWVEGKDLEVVLPSAPAWYYEQYEEIQ